MGFFGKDEVQPEKPVPYWRSVLPQIGEGAILDTADTPCAIFLNLRHIDVADFVELRVTLHGNGASGELWDVFDITRLNNTDDRGRILRYLTVNRTPYSRGDLLQINVPAGPWKARFVYKQTMGTNKKVLYLVRKD